ncbi:MAG: bifunctional UDP-N-acetylglucosamine diphosphorylase/glucosamine-1-phosphate N-acetyltransferase GlmU [Candidatus Dormibacteria bacterium]
MTDRSSGSLRVVILAAGRGTRMQSARSKVMHEVGGLPMIEHLLRAAGEACPGTPLVVASAGQADLLAYLEGRAEAAVQARATGTGGALMAALPKLAAETSVLVLAGDMPLLRAATMERLVQTFRRAPVGAVVLTAVASDSRGFGRISRGADGRLLEIVEAADEPARPGPVEVNCGAYVFAVAAVEEALLRLPDENSQGELYLSWVPQSIAGGAVTVAVEDLAEALQVNDRVQLAAAEAAMRERTLQRLMLSGVTVTDPAATWVDCEVTVGRDTVIHPGTLLLGRTRIGSECVLGPFAELRDCEVGDRCQVGRSHLRGCKLDSGVDVGPFNRVRPGTELGSMSHLGTFNEVVRSRVGAGSQIPHLSYVGDSDLGDDVNVGAGSITANWDGENKQRTVVEDGARLGSDTILVAPVRVGRRSYTAAGSVVTSDVPAGALAVSRAPQRNILGWVARRRPGARPVAEIRAEEGG